MTAQDTPVALGCHFPTSPCLLAQQITESGNGLGWKGPQQSSNSSLPAGASCFFMSSSPNCTVMSVGENESTWAEW